MERQIMRWGILWRSENQLNGRREFLIGDVGSIVKTQLFRTFREARAACAKEYGYIKARPDLQAEPHGWKMPKVVKVTVTIGVSQ